MKVTVSESQEDTSHEGVIHAALRVGYPGHLGGYSRECASKLYATDANLSATNTIVSDTHLGTPGAANVLALIAKNGDITPTGDDGNPFKESANEAGATQVSILYDDEDDQCCDDDVADDWDQDDDPNEFAEADQDWWDQQQ